MFISKKKIEQTEIQKTIEQFHLKKQIQANLL